MMRYFHKQGHRRAMVATITTTAVAVVTTRRRSVGTVGTLLLLVLFTQTLETPALGQGFDGSGGGPCE